MKATGFFSGFRDVWLPGGVRTPMVDDCGGLGEVSPTDLGIRTAREALNDPAPAIRLLLERSGLTLDQIARFEIIEAQGGQTLAVARERGLDRDRRNVNGGAIALGHPLAMTGLRRACW